MNPKPPKSVEQIAKALAAARAATPWPDEDIVMVALAEGEPVTAMVALSGGIILGVPPGAAPAAIAREMRRARAKAKATSDYLPPDILGVIDSGPEEGARFADLGSADTPPTPGA